MSDVEFLLSMQECALPAALWTHEAHVRLAWLLVTQHGYAEGLERIRTTIQRYNERVLKKEGAYHETITVAFSHLIAKAHENVTSFDDLKRNQSALFDSKLSALLHHYRHETLMSAQARQTFVEPDRIPLPVFSRLPGCPVA